MISVVVSVLIGALGVKAQPASLTLGKDTGAQIEVLTLSEDGSPSPGIEISISSTLGEVSPPQALGGGRYRAHFTPPKEKRPQVAIIEVEAKSPQGVARKWLALRLSANAKLKIQTKPKATLNVEVGGATYGPISADSKGRALVAVLVPPGVSAAMVQATDLAGNVTHKPLDLEPKAFPLMRVAANRMSASATDKGVPVELFAIQPDGQPRQDAKGLTVRAQRGKVDEPKAEAPGIFVASYHPPEAVEDGKDALSFELAGSTPLEVEVAVHPGAAARIVVATEPPVFVAGSGKRPKLTLKTADAKGNILGNATASVTSDFGHVEQEGEAQWVALPDEFAGRTQVKLRANAGKVAGSGTVALVPGPPREAKVHVSRTLVRAGEPLEGQFVVHDAFGNPIDDANVKVSTDSGSTVKVKPVGDGKYQVRYDSVAADYPGTTHFNVTSEKALVGTSSEVTFLPYRHPWSVFVGPLVGGQSNFRRSHAFVPRLSLGVQLAHSPIEILAEAERPFYAQFHGDPLLVNGTHYAVDGALSNASTYAFGVRFNWEVTPRICALVTVEGGLTQFDYELTTNAPRAVSPITGSPSLLLLRAAAGATYDMGPGRFIGQLEFSSAQLPTGDVQGNVGGLGLMVGYLFGF